MLIIGNFLSASGGSRGVCEELAERLAAEGWRVLCASRKRPKLFRLADMVLTAAKQHHEYAVAQVDVFSGPAFFWAEAACWTLRHLPKPYVLTLHGGNLPEFAARCPARVRRLLQSAKVVTAPSPYLQQRMEVYCPGIRVIPNAIDITIYPYRQRGPAHPKLIWLRSFHEIYNPVMAVKVLAALATKYPEVQLTMVGPDKGDGSLQQTQAEVAALGLQRHFCYLGRVPKWDVPKALSGPDIFLNTTNFDNTPVSVIEAIGCGLCVVSTNVGGIPNLLRHGKTALLVQPGNVQEMAAAVKRLVTEPSLAYQLSANGRILAESFDWELVLPRWLELFRHLMPGTIKGAREKSGDGAYNLVARR